MFCKFKQKESVHFLKSIKMDTKNVPSVNVEETEESTSSTSLVYNLKEGKWQKSLINDSNDSTSDSECESEE